MIRHHQLMRFATGAQPDCYWAMRFALWCCTALLFGFLPLQATADVDPEPYKTPVKIAVLDWRAALLGTDQARQSFQQIRAELAPDEQEIRQLAQEIRALQDQLKNEAATLGDEDKRQLSKTVQEKAEEYQFLGQRLQKEQRQRQELYAKSARPLLDEAVRQVIADQGISLLIDRQATTYVHPDLDITPIVIEQLNQMHALKSPQTQ